MEPQTLATITVTTIQGDNTNCQADSIVLSRYPQDLSGFSSTWNRRTFHEQNLTPAAVENLLKINKWEIKALPMAVMRHCPNWIWGIFLHLNVVSMEHYSVLPFLYFMHCSYKKGDRKTILAHCFNHSFLIYRTGVFLQTPRSFLKCSAGWKDGRCFWSRC